MVFAWVLGDSSNVASIPRSPFADILFLQEPRAKFLGNGCCRGQGKESSVETSLDGKVTGQTRANASQHGTYKTTTTATKTCNNSAMQ